MRIALAVVRHDVEPVWGGDPSEGDLIVLGRVLGRVDVGVGRRHELPSRRRRCSSGPPTSGHRRTLATQSRSGGCRKVGNGPLLPGSGLGVLHIPPGSDTHESAGEARSFPFHWVDGLR